MLTIGCKRQLFWIFLILLALPFKGRASVATDSLWESGVARYQQGNYQEALSYFLKLKGQGEAPVSLNYNLGNTYYRLNQIPEAILYYERALFKNPSNRQIKDNLNLVQERLETQLTQAQPVFFVRWWKQFIRFSSPSFWAPVMWLCFVLLLGLVYLRVMQKGRLSYWGRWLSLGLSLFAFSAISYFSSVRIRKHSNKAVVMSSPTPYSNSYDDKDSSGTLPAGLVVSLKKQQSSNYLVRLPNGKEVWIGKAHLEKVDPTFLP